jgi:hypothetical protein
LDLHSALASQLLFATSAATHQAARMAPGGRNVKSSAGVEYQAIEIVQNNGYFCGQTVIDNFLSFHAESDSLSGLRAPLCAKCGLKVTGPTIKQ